MYNKGMFAIITTILLVGAFFILFFKIDYNLKNKTVQEPEASTTVGFIKDTRDAFIHPDYPTALMHRDAMGNIEPIYGDTGNFVAYPSIPDTHWLSGFPHKAGEIEIPDETTEEKLQRRVDEIRYTWESLVAWFYPWKILEGRHQMQ